MAELEITLSPAYSPDVSDIVWIARDEYNYQDRVASWFLSATTEIHSSFSGLVHHLKIRWLQVTDPTMKKGKLMPG